MGNDMKLLSRVSACCGAEILAGQRMNGQMFDQCALCRSACGAISPALASTEPASAEAQPAPALPDAPETMHGKDGASENASQGEFQDIVACLDCAEHAEFVTFSDPPIAKCFRCTILKAMERLCALCGRHVSECIVRAVGENERQDVIGICSGCFMKRLSAMRN